MMAQEVMTLEEEAAVLPSCMAPGRGPEHPAPVEYALNQEIADFITRRVLEQEPQFFDG